ncbi:3-keto-disaccharide hydrolase [Candidatus Laterigemmans baculatus]|uniref:3-keto-disaccharide hydrolase n=1 Tax=Candidatus Laterigemmans baculatus TaxID=2770505 RepID=UPI0013D9FE87|nr:DUF1080 domain-containing protein [Candidatus Laterigemmans baculatus]
MRFHLFLSLVASLTLAASVRADEDTPEPAPQSASAPEEAAEKVTAPEEVAEEEIASEEAEWVPLFDGESIEGWIQRGGRADFEVVDGAIVGTTRLGTPNSFLCTAEEFGDFILEYEFRVDPQLNSGVQIRSQSRKDYKDGRVHGYQIEIDPSERAWTGGIYDEARRGWLYTLENRPEARAAFKPEQWNLIRVEARGDSIRTWVNGVPAADLKDDMTARGFIALQVHSTKSAEPLEVSWRNLRIKPL